MGRSIYLPRFTIGADAFDAFGPEMGRYGTKVAVIHGEKAWKAAGGYVLPALEKAGLTVTGCILYGHDATHENCDKLCKDPAVLGADMLLAVGGGKCVDTAKLAADRLDKPVFTAPTIASNCAPVTKISIMYHPDGSFRDIPRLKSVPVHCFIDPRIAAAAPIRYFRAGIGDAMAKHVESAWSAKAGETLSFESEMGINAGKMCFDPLLREGEQALRDAEAGVVTPAVEDCILNVVVSPGVVSVTVHPDYNGGVAHALFYGLTGREHIEKNHLHGEVVSYGVLVSLMLDQDWDKLKRVWRFNKAVGLPACLHDLELERTDPLADVLELTLANQELTHTPYPVTAQTVYQAIQDLEDYKAE